MIEARVQASECRESAPFGSPRLLGVRALWESAPSGSSRPLGVRALWDFAPSGSSRRFASPEMHDAAGAFAPAASLRSDPKQLLCRRGQPPDLVGHRLHAR